MYAMQAFGIYGLILACLIGTRLLYRIRASFFGLIHCIRGLAQRWFVTKQYLEHSRWFNDTALRSMLLQVCLLGGSVLTVVLRATDIQDVARRAGAVAMLSLAVFYLGPGLVQQAYWLELTLAQSRKIHVSMLLSSLGLTIFHAVVLRTPKAVPSVPPSEASYGTMASSETQIAILADPDSP